MSSSSDQKSKVFVVDDDPQVRQSLKMLLSSAGFAVECYASAEQFLDACRTPPNHPSCLLLDIRMPGMSGIGLQAKLSAEGFAIPVIMITGAATVPLAVQAMKAGALDFLEKPFHRQTLLERVQHALDMDAEVRWKRAREAGTLSMLDALSPREHEVMRLLIQGKMTKEIAAELGIGLKTVAKHRIRVLSKMRVDTVVKLTHLVDRLDRAAPAGAAAPGIAAGR